MPRTSPASVLFTTYNMLDLFAGDSAQAGEHYDRITAVIRALGTDVLAVQEILAPDVEVAAQRLRRLADDAGLHCEVPGGRRDPGRRPRVRRPRLPRGADVAGRDRAGPRVRCAATGAGTSGMAWRWSPWTWAAP